jgi:hypothetical protein
MNEVRTSGPLSFTEPGCPTRVGEIINTLSEIYDIPTPRLGMQVFVKDEERTYIVTELKSKTINGVVVPFKTPKVMASELFIFKMIEEDGL